MGHLDLDAKRVARSEAENQPHTVTFGGEEFTLPPVVPLETLDLMADGQFRAAFRIMLDDDEADRFFAHRPDYLDLKQIMAGLYGQGDLPEASASPPSSPSTGTRSRPTSRATTASTSPEPATAPAS